MKIKNYMLSLSGLMFVLIFATPASAVVGAVSMLELYVHIQGVSETWGAKIAQYALGLLWTTSLIAFAIGCKDLALGGGLQIEGVIAIFVRFAFLTGMMSWLLMNPVLFLAIPNSLEKLGGHISGATINFVNISSAFDGMISPLVAYYKKLNWLTEPGLSLVSCVLVFLIHCLSVLFVTTVLLVKIETIFILVGGMFTASFFIIGHFRDIFMGYIKALVMNGLKLLLLSLCLGLTINIMGTWGNQLSGALTTDSGLYDVALPMTFGLMAFYIVIKSVPQYAAAILTGNASADGSLGKAAVMAGFAAGSTVWNTSRGISNTTITSSNAIRNAAQAYKSTSQSVIDSGGSTAKSRTMGAISAVQAMLTTQVVTKHGGGINGTKSGAVAANNTGSNNGNEMKPGGAFDPFKVSDSYDKDMGGKK